MSQIDLESEIAAAWLIRPECIRYASNLGYFEMFKEGYKAAITKWAPAPASTPEDNDYHRAIGQEIAQ